MANIIPLKEPTGAQFYPQTHEKAVVDSNGVTLASKLANISAPSYVVAWDGNSTPVVANIPAGVTFTFGGQTYTGTLAASSSTVNKTYLVYDNNGNFDEYITQVSGSTYSWVHLGNTSIDLSDYATKAELNQLDQKVDGLFGNSANADLDIVDESAYVLARFANGHFQTKNFDSARVNSNFGQQFDSTSAYAEGDIVLYDGLLYKFTSPKTAGDWDLALVEQTSVAELSSQVPTPTTDHPVGVEPSNNSSDLEITDESGSVLARFANGHFQTKNFDSRSQASVQSFWDLDGKTVCFLGDSITEGTGTDANHVYHKVFANLTGCTNINLGLSGSNIAQKKTTKQRFYERATAANLNGASLVVVFGGTNDFNDDLYPIGPLFENNGNNIIAPVDTTAFGGAMHQLIQTIKTNAPGVPIVFMQPINRGAFSSQYRSNQKNDRDETLQDFRNAIDTICRFYSIPVVTLDRIPELDFTDGAMAGTYSADNLHPNNYGNEIIGKALYNFVRNNLIMI